MAGGLFAFMLAGGAQGAGNAIVDQAKAKREAALEDLKYGRLLDRDKAQNDFTASQNQLQRDFTAEQNDLNRVDATKRAEADRYRMLTPDEVKAMGLDESKRYQISGDQKITEVGGGGTVVNVDLKGETKYSEQRNTDFAKDAKTFQDEGISGRKALTSLSIMEEAMNDKNFYSGTGVEMVAKAKKLAAAFGINPDGVSSMEAFNAQAKAAALDAMGGTLGTGFSNADRDFVTDQVANLANSPEGNKKLIEIQKKLNQRKVDIAARAREYEKKNGKIDIGFYEETDAWAEANPLFPKDSPASTVVAPLNPGQSRDLGNGLSIKRNDTPASQPGAAPAPAPANDLQNPNLTGDAAQKRDAVASLASKLLLLPDGDPQEASIVAQLQQLGALGDGPYALSNAVKAKVRRIQGAQ